MRLNDAFQNLNSDDPRDREIAKSLILAFLPLVLLGLRKKCSSLEEWKEACSIGSCDLLNSREYPLLVMQAKNPEGYIRSIYAYARINYCKKESDRQEKGREYGQQAIRKEKNRLSQKGSSTPLDNQDFIILLKSALRRIPKRQAEAFDLRHVNGLSVKEVANRMGIAKSTVKEHLKKSKVSLRKILPSRGDIDDDYLD